MINFFNSLKTIFNTKDEIIGRWENYDDGSGLHTMIWGYGIEFLEDNTGFHYYWGSGEESDESGEDEIIWKRIDINIIEIKFLKENEFKIINYSIQKSKQGYDIDCLEISESNKRKFWISPEPLYKYL